MRVLVLEPHCDGHHGAYLRWMVEGLAGHGVDVAVATLPESLVHPAVRDLVASNPDQMHSTQFVAFPPSRGFRRRGRLGSGGAAALGLREARYWGLLRGWYRSYSRIAQPDIVFVSYLDYALYAIGLLGSPFGQCPWVGLAMRPSFHYRRMGIVAPEPPLRAIKEALFFRMLGNRYLKCLLTIDEALVEYLAAKDAQGGRVLFLPQPADFGTLPSSRDAKRRLGMKSNRKLILVYGGIDRRHGVPELLRALSDPLLSSTVDVLLAGKVHADIRGALNEPRVRALTASGRLTILDRFIRADEESTIFGAADIVWVGYRDHYGASGVATQAERAGRPVIACAEGILGWQTRRHKLGKTVSPEDTAAVIAAIHGLLDEAETRQSDRVAGRACGAVSASYQDATDVLVRALAG